MKVFITLDYTNGEQSKQRVLDLDGTGLSQLSFMMMEAGVIGCTITKTNPLGKKWDKLPGGDHAKRS